MTRSAEPYKTINFFDWTGGITDRRKNPLAFPINALMAGENVELVDGGLSTRSGMSIVSAGSLPAGDILALRQVRFPTNEVSYLVAQAYEPGGIGVDAAALARYGHVSVLNTENGKIYTTGGRTGQGTDNWGILELDPSTGVWTQKNVLLVPNGFLRFAAAAWDPAGSRIIIHGGNINGYQQNAVWAYSPSNHTTTTLIEQAAPDSRFRQYHSGFIGSDGAFYICGGIQSYDDEAHQPITTVTHPTCTLDRLDLNTLTWSTITCVLSGSPPSGATSSASALSFHQVAVYGDFVYIYGGITQTGVPSNCTIVCDLANQTATWGNLFCENGLYHHRLAQRGDHVIICGGIPSLSANFAETFLYGTIGETPNAVTVSGFDTAPNRMEHTLITIGDCVVVVGGRDTGDWLVPASEVYADYWHVNLDTWEVVELHPEELTGGWKLFASADHLPTTTATFTKIADLGTNAGATTTAVLNDRAVFTEGIAKPPWVWGGAMSDDASDWMTPKAVLVSQDGINFYDVSPQVCDKDPDTFANIGNIRSSGYLAVCCDMPEVEGFYFEMSTPNTVEGGTAARPHSVDLPLDDASDMAMQDLKATIDHWVQDSGATGHFENASNVALSLGPGNDCPDVETGLTVNFTGVSKAIITIANTGSGNGEVELESAQTNATVNTITGFVVGDDGLTVDTNRSPWETSWSVAGDQTVRYGGYSIRQVISGADLVASGDTVRITIKVGDGITDWYHYYWRNHGGLNNAMGMVLAIERVSIVERDGTSENGVTTPTPLTFSGGYSHPSHYLEIAETGGMSGPSITSDPLIFEIDENKDYLVIMDIADTWRQGNPEERGGVINRSAGAGFYFKTDLYNPPRTWDQQFVEGFTFVDNYCVGVVEVQVCHNYDVPDQLVVAHTTDAAHVDISQIEIFESVDVTQTTPGSTTIYHAVSLDGRATFQVFKNDAWRTIVREDEGLWQCLDATDTWQNASTDTLLQALRESLAVAENQMSKTELEAITAAQWVDTGGIILYVTATMDFAVGMVASGTDVPSVGQYTIGYRDAGYTTIQGWKAGAWTAGSGWMDNTRVNEVPFAQDGTVTYAGEASFKADYHVLNEVPGFWFRFLSNGTSENCSITRIQYKGPCQPLANIGNGQPDTPLGFVYVDTSSGTVRDYTVEVSDNALSDLSKADIPMAADDYLYCGYYLPFNEIEVTPYEQNNASISVLSAEYWNGEAWAALTITDGTAGTTGKTLSTKGKISWTEPSDWRSRVILDANFARGYYIRLKPSAALSTNAGISEVRIYAVPPPIAKHKLAVTVRDRIALLGRPDAPDQCYISRALEEYGFSGDDCGSYRVGGMDGIHSAVAAWNGLLVGKTETWHQLVGSDPGTFAFDGVEAARQTPVNSEVIVKAPMAGIDAGTRHGLFFLNRFGAFVSTGLHTDSAWNTARGALLSDSVNWWNQRSIPRLYLDGLHRACGEYWPVKNWIIWSVPMVTNEEQPAPAKNNRLIIFDLSLRTWLPPFTISLASLSAAYHYNATGPGKIGDMGLYGGDYDGRIVRLFGPSDPSDLGAPIAAWIETGWLHMGSPEWLKLIRRLQVYGQTSIGRDVTVKIWTDGNTDPASPNHVMSLTDLDDVTGRFFGREEASLNIQGRFFKFRIEFQDLAHIYGMQIGTSFIREWGAV